MKEKLKKIASLFIIIGIMVTTTSCQSKVDIQDLAIVMAMAVDYNDQGKYRVVYQIFTASTFPGGSGVSLESSSGGVVVPTFQGIGGTLAEAMHDMEERIGKNIHFGQIKVVIIGQKAGERGISPIIDALSRLPEIKTNVPIYVTKGEAKKIITQKTHEDTITANVIDNMVLRQIYAGMHPVVYLAHIADELSSKHNVVPVLGVINTSEKINVSDSSIFKLDGMAVFREDKLIGYLDQKITLGYQYIKGDAKVFTTPVRLRDGHKATLRLHGCKSKIKTVITNGKPEVYINLDVKSILMDITGERDFLKNPELLQELESLHEKMVKDTVNETIRAAKDDVKIDFLGVGDVIYRQHPKEYEKIKDKWQELFLDVPIKVTVNVIVKDTGLLYKPIY